jgi:3-methyl-2-oxobutanoate hydroxymethyltransferase
VPTKGDKAKSERRRPVKIGDFRAYKERGERFAVVAAYDFLFAHMIDEAGVPLIPVGDSFGMFALGYETLMPVTLEEMLHHVRAVTRAVKYGIVVGDLPFGTYEEGPMQALASAIRLVKEAGADAVKVEGGNTTMIETIDALTNAGIPVMGHLGFLPQSTTALGGFGVAGRDEETVLQMISDARAQQEAGAFAIVLERLPSEAGRRVTEAIDIPTIGAGAGPHTDAQVMLLPWLLGLTSRELPEWFRMPRWAKQYVNQRAETLDAIAAFRDDVANGSFPSADNEYR